MPHGIWFALLAATATALAFLDTSVSIVSIWSRSETFTHGFFVLPIFLWLIWRERDELATLPPSPPDARPLPLVAGAGLLWLLSSEAGILAGEQLALVLMIILIMHVFAGREIARAIRFPLLFLLFLAPLGEELVPVLMEITADLTVGAIALTGIPIYREGLYFSLPSGNWSVVEACSGIRYLIASVTLGALYAYLSFRSTRRRLAFIVISAVVPIIANGMRAFLIVMIGHFSGMQLATGVDHLVYGWLFFGVVMFLLFSIGAWFREPEGVTNGNSGGAATDSAALPTASGSAARSAVERKTARSGPGTPYLRHVLLASLCVGVWPLWSAAVDAVAATSASPERALAAARLPEGMTSVRLEREGVDDGSTRRPRPVGGSSAVPPPGRETPTDWRPVIGGHDAALAVVSSAEAKDPGKATRADVLALAYVYLEQHQGKEMISTSNVLVRSRDPDWRRVESTRTTFTPTGSASPVSVERARLRSAGQNLLVWRWYRVGDMHTSEQWRVKLIELRERLLLRQTPSVAYVLAVDAAHPDADAALARIAAGIVANDEAGTVARPAADSAAATD